RGRERGEVEFRAESDVRADEGPRRDEHDVALPQRVALDVQDDGFGALRVDWRVGLEVVDELEMDRPRELPEHGVTRADRGARVDRVRLRRVRDVGELAGLRVVVRHRLELRL